VATWQATLDFVRQGDAAGSTALPRAWRAFVGYPPLVVDGVFGPRTAAVTRAYGLPATGFVGLASWKAWIESQLTCCGAGYQTLAEGMALSASVTWWQISLDRWLLHHAPRVALLIPDGIYGPLAMRATMVYQRAVGLDADGIAGTKTWSKLSQAGLVHIA
jgi:peptidoglycan hydrolase-like protein with peptidoglycan-binding domain